MSGGVVNGKVNLRYVCVGLQPKDIDVIVNEHHLIVYGYGKNYLLPKDAHIESFSIRNGHLEFTSQRFDGYKEIMATFRWDRAELFKDLSLEEMKALVAKTGAISFQNGILCLSLKDPRKSGAAEE